MALIDYSPWQDAAQFGSGLGQTLGTILLRLPMMKQQVAQEERRMALEERRVNAAEALNQAHMGLYRAQTDAVPVNQQLARDKYETDKTVGLGNLALKALGTQSTIQLQGAQQQLAGSRQQLLDAQVANMPEDSKVRNTLAKARTLGALMDAMVAPHNAITARESVRSSIARANFDDNIVAPPPLDLQTIFGIQKPAPRREDTRLGTPPSQGGKYPPSPEMNIRFRNRKTGEEGWSDEESLRNQGDLEELYRFEG